MRLSRIAFLAAMLSTSIAAAGPDKNKTDAQKHTQTETDKTRTSKEDGRLGVMVMDLNAALRSYFGAPKDSGLLVAEVVADSPAARAGIKVGDVITKLDSDKVEDVRDIRSAISRLQSPQKVAIELVRDHKSMTVQAALGGRHESSEPHG
ncbi:MAG TPA: PDZ domain-containing protein [Kofleriaceae bacterium]|jgi:S1-C subfamily serine protease